MIDDELVQQEIKDLLAKATGPFPYADLRKMRQDEQLTPSFQTLGENDWLEPDFNTYCMCVEGVAEQMLNGSHGTDIQSKSIQWLSLGDFFDIFLAYRFLEGKWQTFPHFTHIYSSMKRLQEIILSAHFSDEEVSELQQRNLCQGWGHFLGPITTIVVDGEDGVCIEDD